MKYWYFLIICFSLSAFAQEMPSESRNTHIVCKKTTQDDDLHLESCQLGLRVLQGLYVAQDQKRFPPDINIKSLEEALLSGKINANSLDYHGLDREKKANYLYQQMIRATGQQAPTLKSSNNFGIGKSRASMSTGSRGGGFETDDKSLSEDLWY